jgi:hypothetical protein
VSLCKILLQAAVEELEAKIKECNSKGADYDLVSQKAATAAGRRRTTANTPAGGRFFISNFSLVKSYKIRTKNRYAVT